jgi:hypothetical protein
LVKATKDHLSQVGAFGDTADALREVEEAASLSLRQGFEHIRHHNEKPIIVEGRFRGFEGVCDCDCEQDLVFGGTSLQYIQWNDNGSYTIKGSGPLHELVAGVNVHIPSYIFNVGTSEVATNELNQLNKAAEELLRKCTVGEAMRSQAKVSFIKRIMKFRKQQREKIEDAQDVENTLKVEDTPKVESVLEVEDAQRVENNQKAKKIKEIMVQLESKNDLTEVAALFAEISQVAGSKRKVDDADLDGKAKEKQEWVQVSERATPLQESPKSLEFRTKHDCKCIPLPYLPLRRTSANLFRGGSYDLIDSRPFVRLRHRMTTRTSRHGSRRPK